MSASLLDGKKIASQIETRIAQRVAALKAAGAPAPVLATVQVGDDPASEVYVRNKHRACGRVGIESQRHRLPAGASERELLDLIGRLSADEQISGILVQLPLPPQIAPQRVLDAVDPLKDVDAFHPENVGRLVQGRPRFLPCTPHGIVQLLARCGIETAGRRAVIVGRSEIVGKPLAMLLMGRSGPCGESGANATVTVCHSRTPDLAEVTRQADVLIVAIGQPRRVTGEMIKPGAAVVDVGINRTAEGLCGDVDFPSACRVAGHITPVPGGVGPLTVTMLMENTVVAAERRQNRLLKAE